MLKPLEHWICDVCNEVIETAEDGYVIWTRDNKFSSCDFKVVHQRRCDTKSYSSSLPVKNFLGHDGLVMLTSLLSIGTIKLNCGDSESELHPNMTQFVDLLRRFQIPNYEEARTRFADDELLGKMSDANEVYPYLQQQLKGIGEDSI